jgi:hypothetical protein
MENKLLSGKRGNTDLVDILLYAAIGLALVPVIYSFVANASNDPNADPGSKLLLKVVPLAFVAIIIYAIVKRKSK